MFVLLHQPNPPEPVLRSLKIQGDFIIIRITCFTWGGFLSTVWLTRLLSSEIKPAVFAFVFSVSVVVAICLTELRVTVRAWQGSGVDINTFVPQPVVLCSALLPACLGEVLSCVFGAELWGLSWKWKQNQHNARCETKVYRRLKHLATQFSNVSSVEWNITKVTWNTYVSGFCPESVIPIAEIETWIFVIFDSFAAVCYKTKPDQYFSVTEP